ncbi:MAG: hypothetical protein KGK10_11585, partial [Rhodospirillales bacterium]|nr:hypothetical protein [Rhodospirillales bacterium]
GRRMGRCWRPPACRSRPEAPAVLGQLDRVCGGTLLGWARHDRASLAPVTLLVLADGELVARVLANAYREDVAAAGHGEGRHGFALRLPRLAPGTVVEVLREPDGAALPGSPFTLA